MTSYRIALISDIHANELALRRVLDDVRRLGVDQIACLGDVATLGPEPHAVLELVRESCDFFILGNHDEYLLDPRAIAAHTSSPVIVAAVEQCRAELSAAELGLIAGFASRVAVPLTNGESLLLFHGSPDSNNRDLLAETPEATLADALGQHRAELMAGGHTHIQMLRQYRGTWLVNPGSVGLAFERFVQGAAPRLLPHAEYAVVESRAGNLAVTLQRLELDPAALLAAAGRWGGSFAAWLLQQYRR